MTRRGHAEVHLLRRELSWGEPAATELPLLERGDDQLQRET